MCMHKAMGTRSKESQENKRTGQKTDQEEIGAGCCSGPRPSPRPGTITSARRELTYISVCINASRCISLAAQHLHRFAADARRSRHGLLAGWHVAAARCRYGLALLALDHQERAPINFRARLLSLEF